MIDVNLNEVVIFNDQELNLEVKISVEEDTVWLTQRDIAILFNTSSDNIGLHINNILQEKELELISTTEHFSVVRTEGERRVRRKLIHYNLDMVLSIGYRVKSKRATLFRKWATKVLKDYAIKGVVINQKKIEPDTYLQLIEVLKRASDQIETSEILRVLEQYTQGLKLLDDYDHKRISRPEGEVATYRLTYDECCLVINQLSLFNESMLFGKERMGLFESSINVIYQTFDGVDVYPTLEDKAANLLYFLVKNHGFIDGNKRIAAALFVYFLDKNNALVRNYIRVIDNKTLVAITILIAESNPIDKELMINLVMNFLN